MEAGIWTIRRSRAGWKSVRLALLPCDVIFRHCLDVILRDFQSRRILRVYDNAGRFTASRANQAAAQRDSSQVHPTILFLLTYEGELA